MDKLKRDINGHLYKKHYKSNQVGGHELTYKGHKIHYTTNQNDYGDRDTVFISGGRDSGRRPCFVLSIKEKKGTLQSLERGDDCFVDRHSSSKDLVLAAFEIAKEQGCAEVYITDNSFKLCPPYRFNLSDVYFISHGKTWYESIIPLQPFNQPYLEKDRARIFKTSWDSISKYLLKEGADLDFVNTSGIHTKEAGSAITVLNRIINLKNETSCQFFAKYTDRILIASKIASLYGKTWIYTKPTEH
jgi:hypothetical protein